MDNPFSVVLLQVRQLWQEKFYVNLSSKEPLRLTSGFGSYVSVFVPSISSCKSNLKHSIASCFVVSSIFYVIGDFVLSDRSEGGGKVVGLF